MQTRADLVVGGEARSPTFLWYFISIILHLVEIMWINIKTID